MAETKTPASPADLTIAQAITQGITQGMHELAKTMKPQGPLEMAGLTQERIDEITKPPAAQRYRLVPWRSEETGATATAHVVEGKTLKNGRITQLIGYAHPSEAYLHQNEGGHVPDGFPIWKDGSARTITEGKEPEIGDLDPAFKQWRWEQYYQADLRRCIGKELHAHHCQEPDALTRTKWIDGKVGLKD